MTYPIAKMHKAHYAPMNPACDGDPPTELAPAFKFNDAVRRPLAVKRAKAHPTPSPTMQAATPPPLRGHQRGQRMGAQAWNRKPRDIIWA